MMDVWSKLFISSLAFGMLVDAPESFSKTFGQAASLWLTAVYAVCIALLMYEVWSLPKKVKS